MTSTPAQKRAAKKYRQSNIDLIRAKESMNKYIKYHMDDQYRSEYLLKCRLRYHLKKEKSKENDLINN
jgi:hypothetical protein